MDKFEDFYKEHCLDGYGYNPDLNWVFEKHEDGSYIQIEVENAKKVFQHQQSKVEELQKRVDSLGKAEFKLAQVKAILQNNPKLLESILVKKLEQALKGESNG